ncbi:hypothetical protein MBLNU457_g0337t1 [Dothideomycetes sp. NU457]
MRFSAALAIAANLALSSAAAIPAVQERSTSLLQKLGVMSAINALSNNGANVWIGDNGPYVTEYINNSGEDIEVVIWGSASSWVNVASPLIAQALAPGQSFKASFASGVSGAWSAIYEDTQMLNGQISNTWGEYTFNGQFSTFDVSRLPNMAGHGMTIETDNCKSDMNTCVFTCQNGNTCMTGYNLLNCNAGSQPGASSGTYAGAPSGGCLVGTKTFVTTTFQ